MDNTLRIVYSIDFDSLTNDRKFHNLTRVDKKQLEFDLNKGKITLMQGEKSFSFYSSMLCFFSGVFGGTNYLRKNRSGDFNKLFVSDYGRSFNFNITMSRNRIKLSSTYTQEGVPVGKEIIFFEEDSDVLLKTVSKTALLLMDDIIKVCPEYGNNEEIIRSQKNYSEAASSHNR